MSKARATYRIVLRGAKGGFAKLKNAKSFELWYGKRRIVAVTPFPARIKNQKQKQNFLKRFIRKIEVRRLELLEIRRQKTRASRQKKKVQKKLRKKAKTEKRKLYKKSLEETKFTREFQRKHAIAIESETEEEDQLPVFEEAHAEAPTDYKNVEVKDITVIPIEPDGSRYEKRLVEKMIHGKFVGDLRLSILDFTVFDDIMLDRDNFKEAYLYCFELFMPHIYSFFNETKDSTDAYILRIKFKWEFSGFTPQGISLPRQQLQTREGMKELFRHTFAKFFGSFSKAKNGLRTRNYLTGDNMLFITGFTLEGTNFDSSEFSV